MKVGDLVRPITHGVHIGGVPIVEESWIGLIIDLVRVADAYGTSGRLYPIVYWNQEYSAEQEFPDQISVIS